MKCSSRARTGLARTPHRRETSARPVPRDGGDGSRWWAAVLGMVLCGLLPLPARSQETYSDNARRLAAMTDEEKERLRKKKEHFDQLTVEQQERLRQLHASIGREENADGLLETATRYARWLDNLDPQDRFLILDTKDPQQRIAKIKEVINKQEERRFQQYAFTLPEDDLKAIYKWLGEWVASRFGEIRERLPRDARERIDAAPDDESRNRAMVDGWQRALRYSSRVPTPSAADYSELFSRFSSGTQNVIDSQVARDLGAEPEAQRSSDRQRELKKQRLEYLVRTALFSRYSPVVSEDELLKFYASMKPDDPRRERLEGKEGGELRRELQRMYNWERMVGRGFGPPGGRGGFGPPGPGWGPPGPPWGPPPGGRGDGGRGGRPDDRRREQDPGNEEPVSQ